MLTFCFNRIVFVSNNFLKLVMFMLTCFTKQVISVDVNLVYFFICGVWLVSRIFTLMFETCMILNLAYDNLVSGLAFHPIDGIRHVIALFLVPTHFTAHVGLLFIEAIWTDDCVDGKIWPVMGAGYHTIHHTACRHNYGHHTAWMDWMFGTLRDPAEDEIKKM